MTGGEWEAISRRLPLPAWLWGVGAAEAHCRRAVVDAIRYIVDNGAKWRALPVGFPPFSRVCKILRTLGPSGGSGRTTRPAPRPDTHQGQQEQRTRRGGHRPPIRPRRGDRHPHQPRL
ncbi:transposase [Streptomyces erythrochromogenes]|uniref:transposase n=1 Tax=Streptomyces erythrochromogenes TaxID=285574 RepID=UPI0036896B8E